MTKAEIVKAIADESGIEKTQVLAVVEAFMEVVKKSLVAGEPVYLRGFGSSSSTGQRRQPGTSPGTPPSPYLSTIFLLSSRPRPSSRMLKLANN